MHSAYGTGALAWSRRQSLRNHPNRCQQCGKVDMTGLIAPLDRPTKRLCTKCFVRHLAQRERSKP